MARWRIVAGTGLRWKDNENPSVGHVIADRCDILPSGDLCFYKGADISEAFGAGAWRNVSRVEEEPQNTSAKPDEPDEDTSDKEDQ